MLTVTPIGSPERFPKSPHIITQSVEFSGDFALCPTKVGAVGTDYVWEPTMFCAGGGYTSLSEENGVYIDVSFSATGTGALISWTLRTASWLAGKDLTVRFYALKEGAWGLQTIDMNTLLGSVPLSADDWLVPEHNLVQSFTWVDGPIVPNTKLIILSIDFVDWILWQMPSRLTANAVSFWASVQDDVTNTKYPVYYASGNTVPNDGQLPQDQECAWVISVLPKSNLYAQLNVTVTSSYANLNPDVFRPLNLNVYLNEADVDPVAVWYGPTREDFLRNILDDVIVVWLKSVSNCSCDMIIKPKHTVETDVEAELNVTWDAIAVARPIGIDNVDWNASNLVDFLGVIRKSIAFSSLTSTLVDLVVHKTIRTVASAITNNLVDIALAATVQGKLVPNNITAIFIDFASRVALLTNADGVTDSSTGVTLASAIASEVSSTLQSLTDLLRICYLYSQVLGESFLSLEIYESVLPIHPVNFWEINRKLLNGTGKLYNARREPMIQPINYWRINSRPIVGLIDNWFDQSIHQMWVNTLTLSFVLAEYVTGKPVVIDYELESDWVNWLHFIFYRRVKVLIDIICNTFLKYLWIAKEDNPALRVEPRKYYIERLSPGMIVIEPDPWL